ncbi:glycerophosphodiester phosphodiesterase family protein [Celerinatantimonas sp. YJH-8]|uniref:glycerophosphodiester phosphodiesterase family protein n=1 Tax=Celerinatantimonas sp. YJH-8 TaxID=3228714 RepID=UPI0038C4A883
MILAGHRALAGVAPENTLSGLQLAAAHHLPWIESDVQLTRDHIPVMIHDATIDRCSNGHGYIRDLDYQQLQQWDFGSWFSADYCGEQLPTLEQWLTCCQKFRLSFNLELKLEPEDDPERLVLEVARVLKQCRFPEQQLIISSFSLQALQHAQQQLPSIRRGQLWDDLPRDWESQLSSINAFSVHPNYEYLNQTMVHTIQAAGYKVCTYTPNQPQVIQQLRHWGVDMAISDQAHQFL